MLAAERDRSVNADGSLFTSQAESETMRVGWSFSIQGRARSGDVHQCPAGQSLGPSVSCWSEPSYVVYRKGG